MRKPIRCVEQRRWQWTIEPGLVGHDRSEPGIEWMHCKRRAGTAQRGDEWQVLDAASAAIRGFRACHAEPAVADVPIGEPVDFDYNARGHHLRGQ